MNIQPGDKIIREMEGFRDGQFWENPGKVLSVSSEKIVCVVSVDIPRQMVFDATTGISVHGKDYGWIKNFAQ